jgi:cytochrome c-type biogenesis protein CcmH
VTSQNIPESEAVNQGESPQPKPPEQARSLPFARIALIGAALIAVVAIGLSLRGAGEQSTPTTAREIPAGDANAAIAQLEAKLKDNPNDAQGWQMLGWALMQTQKFPEAAQAYARATQIDPKNADYWSSLGEARVLAK